VGKGAVKHGTIAIAYAMPASLHGQRVKLAVNAGGPSFKGLRISHLVSVQ
jgi:hypothetical protein